jgi:hypothetical protein
MLERLAFLPGAPLRVTAGMGSTPPRQRARRAAMCAPGGPPPPAIGKAAKCIGAASGMGTGAFASAVSGEWFGYEVSFAVNDGAPVPVEERYVPDEFRNWGVEVHGFEEVCSTQVVGSDGKAGGDGDGAGAHLYLKRTRALPSVGCEADAVASECKVERLTATNTGEVTVPEYGVKGSVVTGAALGFADGGWSAGPSTFAQGTLGRWYAAIAHPDATPRQRARLEFGTVNVPRGSVIAYVETHEGPFCDGELLPGCGGVNASFAPERAVTAEELVGEWLVDASDYVCVAKAPGRDGEHVVSEWSESHSSLAVVRSAEQVADEVDVYMPKGLTVGMHASADGEMCFSAGWLTSPTLRAVVARVYGPDGRLVRISKRVETKAAKV